MKIEIVTREELQTLRLQILSDIKELIGQGVKTDETDMRGYKTKDIRNILGCSYGKLKSLRANGRIRAKKIGGTIYYNKEDIRRLVTTGF